MDTLSALLYRNRAERALEAFQRDDEIGPSDRREPGFEVFVRTLLELLEEHRSLRAVGVRIASAISTDSVDGAVAIIVRQRLAAITEGILREPLDVEALYAQSFPRNGVFDGAFVLNRDNPLVCRYAAARENGDGEEEVAAIANLCRAAEAAFTPATIRFLFDPA